jgi:hypothetical protein
MFCGRLNFGEAVVVGGDDLWDVFLRQMIFLGCFPPAGTPSPEVRLFFTLLLRQTTPSLKQRCLGKAQL